MTKPTVLPSAVPRYGFNIYRDGVLVREQIVEAGTAAIAEVLVYRDLDDNEYPAYAVPRLVEDEDQDQDDLSSSDGKVLS